MDKSLHKAMCCSDIEDDVRSLQQFTTAMFVDATAQCLKMIKPGVDVPHKLPPSMSACFRVGSRLAAVIKVMSHWL